MVNFRLSRKRKKDLKKQSLFINKNEWNWIYHKEKVIVNAMYAIFNSPTYGHKDEKTGKWISYETPIENNMSNEELLEWYEKNYPKDKLKHHWCKHNRYKF